MTVDSDALQPQVLESAFALPAALYTNPQIAERESSAVFARHWQLVAHADQVRDAGDHAVVEIGGVPGVEAARIVLLGLEAAF